MSHILDNEKQIDLFKKQFPDMDEKHLEKVSKNIQYLYEETIDDVKRLIERGFNEDYSNIIFPEWLSFISKTIPKIEKIKNLKVGQEKLETLIAFLVFLIIKSLPIPDMTKEVLVTIVKEVFPPMAEAIIYTSKRIHTFFSWLRKKMCC